MVTIVICYRSGTSEMLKVCLESLQKHTAQETACVVATTNLFDGELQGLQLQNRFSVIEVKAPEGHAARVHGNMLDAIIPAKIDTEYVLTLDSDCFPIADGWLDDLLSMAHDARLVGILHPWAPPPDDMLHTRIAWRVRSQQCWNNTHVACQMIRVADYKELQESCKVSYAGGDDTGLLITLRAKEKGWRIAGWMPTRCPLPSAPGNVTGGIKRTTPFDPEFNRIRCVVFGDKICHIGSYTLAKCGLLRPDSEYFDWAVERILGDGGAEFLLQDRLSYRYKFDREEEAAELKMNQIFGGGFSHG